MFFVGSLGLSFFWVRYVGCFLAGVVWLFLLLYAVVVFVTVWWGRLRGSCGLRTFFVCVLGRAGCGWVLYVYGVTVLARCGRFCWSWLVLVRRIVIIVFVFCEGVDCGLLVVGFNVWVDGVRIGFLFNVR